MNHALMTSPAAQNALFPEFHLSLVEPDAAPKKGNGWVQGEIAPAFPDKERWVTFTDAELTRLRYSLLVQTLKELEDPKTKDEDFLNSLDWILQNHSSDWSFGQCCAAATKVRGEPVYPDFIRNWQFDRVRDRLRDIKTKHKLGAFQSYFRGQGRPADEIIWIKGETPPPYPDKPRMFIIQNEELTAWRRGVLKITLEIMEDPQTCDEEFLDCLDWVLDDDKGGFAFTECALATEIDGDRCEPEALRYGILHENRDRIRDLRKKAKEGAFEDYFRFL